MLYRHQRKPRVFAGLAFSVLALLWVTPYAAAAEPLQVAAVSAEVFTLRVGQTPDRTRLVFDVSNEVAFRLAQQDDPRQLVVEMPAVSSRFDHGMVPVRGTPIENIVAMASTDNILRYQINLSETVEPRLFALKPYLGNGHRVVLDLYKPSQDDTANADASTESLQVAAKDSASRSRNTTARSATRIEIPAEEKTAGEWSGYVSLESRLFLDDPRYAQQEDHSVSIAFEPQFYMDFSDGSARVAFRPFFRYDSADDERSHVDLRELYWRGEYNDVAVKLGMDVVFWGVTESQHLVDIINQTDFVENIDGEDKLGQPMLNIDYTTDWGTWQAYVLPYFRERTFPGPEGRLRSEPFVDADEAVYESGDKEKHIDLALRWSHYIGDWDIGLAHFTGTSRMPRFLPGSDPSRPSFIPYYLQIDQTSLDVQATKGAWLWKLEALYNSNRIEDYAAAVGGFEYTWFGAGCGDADIGWLFEYHYDERDDWRIAPFQEDVFLGVRYTGNDMAGTRVLAGVIVDTDTRSTFGNLEAVRRLGEHWTATLEARVFTNVDTSDLMRYWDRDDYIELQFTRFF